MVAFLIMSTLFIHLFMMQKLKTSVKKKTVNPEWNEELTLSVSDPTQTIRLVCLSSPRQYLCLMF